MCGGTDTAVEDGVVHRGLSPRVRGNLQVHPYQSFAFGSIPACAGEPPANNDHTLAPAVYPRVCGGTYLCAPDGILAYGLSPRVRGNRKPDTGFRQNPRSIPACAGEPRHLGRLCRLSRVYPRVCGGTRQLLMVATWILGLSPRVRGNRYRHRCQVSIGRSIPACAGEPRKRRHQMIQMTVYPRVCGGTHLALYVNMADSGLSPRVRGNPPSARGAARVNGSIPACAGEPGNSIVIHGETKVYPRVCGGTTQHAGDRRYYHGLSPRVRGNPGNDAPSVGHIRSIPACAGEPSPSVSELAAYRVYPRVCGGTRDRNGVEYAAPGLSPRVRGNLDPVLVRPRLRGSIPACAGEPTDVIRRYKSRRVYPRVCGGTIRCLPPARRALGLSPRVRGNRTGNRRTARSWRSIPACAGEPYSGTVGLAITKVYPRVCGGTLFSGRRGFRRARSIPACAGEPIWEGDNDAVHGVYPRVCGGTLSCRRAALPQSGLSPRVRGNLLRRQGYHHRCRSIPACAGEPQVIRARGRDC